MSLPWYWLEPPARATLLRCYYAVCAFAYPVYVGLTWNKSDVFAGSTLRDQILNPKAIKK